MVLQDKKYTSYLSAVALVIGGLLIACLFSKHSFVALIVGLAFMGVGAFLLFRTRSVTIELDRSAGNIHILFQGIKSKEERDMSMAQIQKIFLRKLTRTSTTRTTDSRGHSSSSSKTYYQYILVFVTDKNEELQFDFGKVSAGLMNLFRSPDETKRQDAEKIANFIGVPLEMGIPSAKEALGAIREGFMGRYQNMQRTS
jgi:hypothetical protein